MKKMIGIATLRGRDPRNINIPRTYTDFVERAGYDYVLLPNVNERIINALDGILLPGGPDIDPTLFGEDNINSNHVDPVTDRIWLEIVEIAYTKSIPVFGICKGHQLIFRAMQGKFPKFTESMKYVQHLSGHRQGENDLTRDTMFHKVYQSDGNNFFTNSFHHQGILIYKNDWEEICQKKQHSEIFPTGISHTDKQHFLVVELMDYNMPEWRARTVQWHPEEYDDGTLLSSFFK